MIQFLKSYIVFVILSLSWVWGDCDEGEVELWDECYNIEETTFLQLSWNGLTGEIPPTIGNLTYLTKLWLYSNELSGEIPLEIGNLTNLTEFYLWENQLTGEIPLEIGNLINLDGIDLHSNQFAGEIPSTVGNLTNLTYLNFSLNELTGEIPESICNLTIDFSIYNFHIENNQFCPPYPSCIEEYVGYQDTTNCSSCEEGEVMLWNECYSIEYTTELDLSYGGLTGEIPPEIGNLINLISLILKENQLNGEIPPEISYLTNLTNLDLGGNQLNGAIPLEIGFLTNLTILDLGGNQLNGAIPTEIGNLTNLTDLELGGNHLTGEIPSEIDNLVNLIFLHLEYNQLTGEIPPEIGNLINLIWLNLVNNQLIGEIPSSICNLDMNWSNPENFNIYDNQLCPPYPSCVEDYVGEQDTTNCGQGNVTVDYLSGWNLVGLPLDVEDASYSILFPESIEGTLYSFNGGYNLATSLIQGEGYWLRFANDGNTTITGNIINELTISLSEGWNLITGLSTSFNISDIQDPDGIIIAGTVYGFASGGYSNEEIIEPGKGYWIRANNSGSIILTSE